MTRSVQWRTRSRLGLLGVLLLNAALTFLVPSTSVAQSEVISSLPDINAAQSAGFRRLAYPDWDGAVLSDAGLAERKRTEGGIIGTLSLRATKTTWISVLYYSETGKGYSLLDALPLPPGQHTELTFPLPPGDTGLTRLVCWTAEPGSFAIEAVLRTPLDPRALITGFTDERWFQRTAPSQTGPTTDERQRFERAPAGILRSRGPYIWANLGTDGSVTAKNCTVMSNTPTRVGNDTWGPFGQWQLGTAGNWQVQFVLPSRREISHAVLRLDGQLSSASGTPRPVTLQLDLNEWRAGELQPVSPAGSLEQLSLDLSQNIQYGLNTLALRTAGGGGDWLLQRFELWVE